MKRTKNEQTAALIHAARQFDVANLSLPASTPLEHASDLVTAHAGDRIEQFVYAVGGREMIVAFVVRAWANPHPTHDLVGDHCTECGAAPSPVVPSDLSEPCGNDTCSRCGQLNGLTSASCDRHGTRVKVPE